MELKSCLYDCSVMHHRLRPKEYRFQHQIFMFYLDLDELDLVARKLVLFSHNRVNFYSFRDNDHFPTGTNPLKDRVMDYLAKNGVDFDPRGKIKLLTLPRVAGYIFNPVSFYFCFRPDGGPVCAVAEVGNTFREMKLFLLRPEASGDSQFRKTTAKHFYVSPFSNLDLNFEFNLRAPGEKLAIRIDDADAEGKVLLSALSGQRKPLTNARLLWLTFKCPLVTMKVIFLIHFHAWLLYLKHVPFHRKAANPELQLEVLRPHSSLSAKSK